MLIKLASGLAVSAFSSHGKSNFEKSKETVNSVTDMFLNVIPYASSKTADSKESSGTERDAFVRKFNRLAPKLKELENRYKAVVDRENKATGKDPNKIDI